LNGQIRTTKTNVKAKIVSTTKKNLVEKELRILSKLHTECGGYFVRPYAVLDSLNMNVIDGEQFTDHVALVLEQGTRNLDQFLFDDGRDIDHLELLPIISRLVAIVAAAHKHQIVLMDIKGANFVYFRGEREYDYHWRGIDLDGAAVSGTDIISNVFDSIMITPSMAAPEILSACSSLKASPKIDMWSLGMMIFRIVKRNVSLWSCLGYDTEEAIILAVQTNSVTQDHISAVLKIQFPDSGRDGPLRRVLESLLQLNPSLRLTCADIQIRGLLTTIPSINISKIVSSIDNLSGTVKGLQSDVSDLQTVSNDIQVQINDHGDKISSNAQQILGQFYYFSKNKEAK
jgi:serine/threonine protein kinase